MFNSLINAFWEREKILNEVETEVDKRVVRHTILYGGDV